MADHRMDRRAMLRLGLGATAGTVVGGLGASGARPGAPDPAPAACAKETPVQETGPFYPDHDQPDKDADLTRIKGHSQRAEGEVIRVTGRILDESCAPVANAVVEIWHASAKGRYSHERDTNPTPVDPNFQGRAQLVTDADGRYAFTTIKPGPYPTSFAEGKPAEGASWRTPHIHFRVARRGFHDMVTQMYFPGEALNATDGVMHNLPESERARCIAAREPAGGGAAPPAYRFEVTMRRVETHAPVPAELLDALVGDYQVTADGQTLLVRVSRAGDQLYATVPPIIPRVELRPLGGLRFSAAPINNGSVLEFEREGTQRATAAVLRQADGTTSRAERVTAAR